MASNDKPLTELSAVAAARAIAQGKITSRQLVGACLDRIASRDETVGAWEHLDPAQALAQAAECDRTGGKGPLRGVPVGIKDIIETADMPTCYGSALYRNNRTQVDAECVRRLRGAGAVILGKTVTTEFAVVAPGKTTNPHNVRHTPGGSSSGSAAAVADGQVPIALGTQTAGSVIRPASFCGVLGYKPSFARFPFDGVMLSSMTLDTLGIFARTFEDAAVVGRVLAGMPPNDFASANPIASSAPRIGLFRTPWWSEADTDARETIVAVAEALAKAGASVSEVNIAGFEGLRDAHGAIMYRELAISRRHEYENHRESLSTELARIIEAGRALGIAEVQNAIRVARRGRQQISEVFAACDVLLTPSARGAAPVGLGNTGDPIFNRVWTLLGVPCLTYPAAFSATGLPLGVQVVGPLDSDERLLSIVEWMREKSTSANLKVTLSTKS
jgi:Asp-tRNA(Asn)/Glu-tRNA(Gln) amidotransferase A subunit family amidase